MKRVLLLTLAVLLAASFAACNSSGGNSSSEQAAGVREESSDSTPVAQDAATNVSPLWMQPPQKAAVKMPQKTMAVDGS